MFSSNQKFEISGGIVDITELKTVLEFALKYNGAYNSLTRTTNPTKYIYQIGKDGKYYLGIDYGSNYLGEWKEYPFDFDIEIVARIILQHLNKQEINYEEYEDYDGTIEKGFVIKTIEDTYENDEKINDLHKCIVVIEPYTVFYAK